MLIVPYLRVSTRKQGQSGLGLEAQEMAIAAFRKAHNATVVQAFAEVESGRNSSRPELIKAIRKAKQAGAVLLVAKLDRLARNVLFIAQLMESGVDFRACDMAEANRLTLHIMAAVAEAEAKAISDRTIAALAAAKKRHVKLGTHNPKVRKAIDHAKGSRIGLPRIQALRAKAHAETYQPIEPILREMREDSTLQEIADRLNGEGYATVNCKAFTPTTVKRLLALLPAVALAASF